MEKVPNEATRVDFGAERWSRIEQHERNERFYEVDESSRFSNQYHVKLHNSKKETLFPSKNGELSHTKFQKMTFLCRSFNSGQNYELSEPVRSIDSSP